MADLVFTINGADYPITDVAGFINSLTIDECGIFYDWTGVLIEDIDDAPVTSRMIAAFMQIAYMRGNPGTSPQVAREAVGRSNFSEAFKAFSATQEDDARPPEPRSSEPEQNGSPGNVSVLPLASGTDSTPPSETPTSEHSPSGSPPWGLSVTSGSTT